MQSTRFLVRFPARKAYLLQEFGFDYGETYIMPNAPETAVTDIPLSQIFAFEAIFPTGLLVARLGQELLEESPVRQERAAA